VNDITKLGGKFQNIPGSVERQGEIGGPKQTKKMHGKPETPVEDAHRESGNRSKPQELKGNTKRVPGGPNNERITGTSKALGGLTERRGRTGRKIWGQD